VTVGLITSRSLGFLHVPWSPIKELVQMGVRCSNAPEDHSSKSVEPKARER
jgi:hypothetical protein